MAAPKLYWWSPARMPKSLAVETLRNTRGWYEVLRGGRARISNFGDAVNPLVFEYFTARRPRWSSARSADYAVIGSVIETLSHSGSHAIVLGAGLRSGQPSSLAPSLQVEAVRGLHSAKALGLSESAAIGDPGLVIRQLLGQSPRSRTTRVLVIPHFSAPNHREARSSIHALRVAGAKIVFPNEHPLEVARAIASSQLVLTSSLHAMVFADSLGVPVQRTHFTTAGGEPEFKYRDYESVFSVESDAIQIASWVTGDIGTRDVLDRLEARTSAVDAQRTQVIDRIHAAFAKQF